VAVLVGAGVAFAHTLTGAPVAGPALAASPGGHSLPDTSALERSPTTAPPAPNPVLPFNAKLTSEDIPVPGGGVRSGACSGALVAPQWIVTAGHCFHNLKDARIGGRPPYTMTVTVGRLKDSDPGGHTAEVVDVRQSPVNDLAVAKLSTAVPDIVPVTLAETRPTVGEQLQFAGSFFVSGDDRTGRLVAIVNTGPPCPQPGPETIARVDVVADWIREQTG
jgi:hypothetical protein